MRVRLSSLMYLLILFGSLPNLVRCRSPPDTPAHTPVRRQALDPKVDSSCNDHQKRIVAAAWLNAGYIARDHTYWSPPTTSGPGQYQNVMDDCLGTESRDDQPQPGGTEGPLRQNVLRQKGIHYTDNTYSPPETTFAFFLCGESGKSRIAGAPQNDLCNGQQKNVKAYTFAIKRDIRQERYIVFCPVFFNKMLPIAEIHRRASTTHRVWKDNIEYWIHTRETTILHETYHWSEVSQPRCHNDPEYYGALDVARLARDANTNGNAQHPEGAKLNAESWSIAAISIYVMKAFRSSVNPMSVIMSTLSPRRRALSQQDVGLDRIRRGNSIVTSNFTGRDIDLDAAPDWFRPPEFINPTTLDPNTGFVSVSEILKTAETSVGHDRSAGHNQTYAKQWNSSQANV